MGRVFSWEYFSFLNIDEAAAYKEMLILPLLIPILFFVWLKLVRTQKSQEDMTFMGAYQDTLANEIDSGTELDSPDEAEEETPAKKDEAEKKED